MLAAELKASLEACPTAALILNAAGMIVFANAGANRLFSPHGDIIGSAARRFLPDWPLPSHQQRLQCADGLAPVCC